MSDPGYFVVFPYLRTGERFTFREIEFRSSDDLDDLPEQAQTHLRAICSLFYHRDKVQITKMVCAHIPAPWEQWAEREQTLREVQALLAYLYTGPDESGSPWFEVEIATVYTFHPKAIASPLIYGLDSPFLKIIGAERPSLRMIDGFAGVRNWEVRFEVDATTRIYPDVPLYGLNDSLDVACDVGRFASRPQNWAFEDFYAVKSPASEEVRRRVQVALEWHARSCRRSITETESLAHMAIALEALLKIGQGKAHATERFKDAVTTLLGPVERLDWWLSQFYDARSAILHEGAPLTLSFFPVDLSKMKDAKKTSSPHGSLLSYARRIFRLCLDAVVTGAVNTGKAGLAKMLVSNQDRVESICEVMRQKDSSPAQRLERVRQEVAELQHSTRIGHQPRLESVLAATHAVLTAFKDVAPQLSKDESELLEVLLTDKLKDDVDRLDAIEKLAKMLAVKDVGTWGDLSALGLSTTQTFLEYAANIWFRMEALTHRRLTVNKT